MGVAAVDFGVGALGIDLAGQVADVVDFLAGAGDAAGAVGAISDAASVTADLIDGFATLGVAGDHKMV